MVAARHEHAVAVVHGYADVERAIARVDALNGPPVRSLQPMVVQLLEIRLAGQVLSVVLVGRVTGPVAAGRQHFGHQQRFGRLVLHEDVVDGALHAARAAGGDANVGWSDQPRDASFARPGHRASTDCELHVVAERLQDVLRSEWHIQRVGWTVEGRRPAADLRPGLAGRLGATAAGEHDDARFFAYRLAREALASAQTERLKADIPPAS